MSITTRPMWLVYKDDEGSKHYQPYADITSAGTLIDPETGDDMELVGWTDREPGTVPETKEDVVRYILKAMSEIHAFPVRLDNEEVRDVDTTDWDDEKIISEMFQTGEDVLTFEVDTTAPWIRWGSSVPAKVSFLNTSSPMDVLRDWWAQPGSAIDDVLICTTERWIGLE